MMKLLLVYATQLEVKGLRKQYNVELTPGKQTWSFRVDNVLVDVLVTGVGMVNTAYQLGKLFNSNSYDVGLNIGLAGSFDRSIELGTIVNVTSECISELGVEDGDNFLRLDQVSPQMAREMWESPSKLINETSIESWSVKKLMEVNGITVNTVHGNEASIRKIEKLLSPTVESMEGAAFFTACLDVGMPFAEIRAISNYVEKRDSGEWEVEKSLSALNEYVDCIIRSF